MNAIVKIISPLPSQKTPEGIHMRLRKFFSDWKHQKTQVKTLRKKSQIAKEGALSLQNKGVQKSRIVLNKPYVFSTGIEKTLISPT